MTEKKRAAAVIKSGGKGVGSIVSSLIGNIVLLIFSITCVFPVIWLFYASLNDKMGFNANPVALPMHPSFANYEKILSTSPMLTWMLNTVRNTSISLFFIILLGFVIGYFLSRYRFKGRNALYAFFLLGIVIPLHALMIPMYVLFKDAGIIDKWFTLLFPYISFGLPISIFLVESYMYSIPKEMEEAATIDGCTFTQTLFRIILPMCTPVLVTAGIIQFFACWNEFSFALILISKNTLMTVPVGMTLFKGQYVNDYPSMMAIMFLSLLPAILIYFAFSKQIIKGMVAGAVKG